MLTVSDLRDALSAPNPMQSLEALVVRELDTGRTRDQLSNALADLLPTVREMPGYTDDWEDFLVEVVDRLTGWTLPTYQLCSTSFNPVNHLADDSSLGKNPNRPTVDSL